MKDSKMITVRLDRELEEEVTAISKDLGISKSDVVRESITQYVSQKQKLSAYAAGKHLFGQFDSGNPNLSQNTRRSVADKIREKKG